MSFSTLLNPLKMETTQMLYILACIITTYLHLLFVSKKAKKEVTNLVETNFNLLHTQSKDLKRERDGLFNLYVRMNNHIESISFDINTMSDDIKIISILSTSMTDESIEELNIYDLKTGTYIVQVINEKGDAQAKKLVINK
jgi:hypothetical protein